jgi:hypothetical protein
MLDQSSDATPQHGANEDIGINHQTFMLHDSAGAAIA